MPRVIVFCLLCLAGPPVAAADFPPVTDAERALDAVPWQPGAPAVVLFRKGEFRLQDYRGLPSSYKVSVRLKILTEEGKKYGEQWIPHGSFRLKEVHGRTVLADGRIVPTSKDAVLTVRPPSSPEQPVTTMVFPAVEVGAILDYEYTILWETPLTFPIWFFQLPQVPTRLSEITYIVPRNIGLQPWARQASRSPIQTETRRTSKGNELRYWSDALPGIDEEPNSLPFADLASRVILVPTFLRSRGASRALFDSWATACRRYATGYRDARRKDHQGREKARELTAGEGSRLDKIAAVHAFVRDEIETDVPFGVWVTEDDGVDAVLAAGRGRPVAKALLLQSMLAGLDVDSDLVWVADRTAWRVDFRAVTPWWFDAALVRIEIDREPMYLDPCDRSLGLGHIPACYEGTRGLIFHPETPEIVELPCASFEHNLRRAVVDLEIGEDGVLEGGGTLVLEGHQAGHYLGWKVEAVSLELSRWLATRFKGFEISDVELEREIRRQHVRVDWSLERQAKEAPGEEVAVQPSLPLGPMTQLFTLPPGLRKTPVLMEFGLRDDLILTLRWPPGWEVDVLPEDMTFTNTAGRMECRVEADEVKRSITFRRRFERTGREFAPGASYSALRSLYAQASEGDGRSLILIRKKT